MKFLAQHQDLRGTEENSEMAAAVERRMFIGQKEGQAPSNSLQLFTKVAPRRRIDAFGRDTTSYSDYVLSMTVFPRGVRTPLISDLQSRSSELTKEYMETTGAIVRHSWQTERQEIPVKKAGRADLLEEMSAPRNTPISINSAATCTDHVEADVKNAFGEIIPHRGDVIPPMTSADAQSQKESTASTSSASEVGLTKNASTTKSGEIFTIKAFVGPKANPDDGKEFISNENTRTPQTGAKFSKTLNNKASAVAVPRATNNVRITAKDIIFSKLDQSRNMTSSTPGASQRASGTTTSHTRTSGRTCSKRTTPREATTSKSSLRTSGMSASSQRLREYSWDTGEKPRKSRADARDTLYILTYCPEERPLRWRESTLPGVETQRTGRETDTISNGLDAERGQEENARESTRHKASPSKGRVIPLRTSQLYRTVDDYKKDPFEVKKLEESHDQRDTLRGKMGCLHSKVKQCIRLVKHQDHHRNSHKVDRPLKKENCSYRPFSTTSIRTPAPTPDPAFRREQRSTEVYRAYKERETRRRTHTKSACTVASGALARNNTAASNYFDVDSRVVQSVMDVNRPNTAGTRCTSAVSSNVIEVPTINAWMNLEDDVSNDKKN